MLPNVQRTDAADHVPVLADEVRELLAVQPGETIVDATFGAGGHSRLLATDLQGSGKLVAIDRDPTVRSYFDRVKASTRGVQMRFLRGDYAVVLSQLAGNGVRADAVLLDLGLSSMQVDRPERGFSYATDAPLDMRMDPSDELSAAAVLADRDERELETIFRRYGEERYARQIARGIVRRRGESPIERTGQLVDVVRASIPAPARFGEGHPAKRVFQALRIEVNHELESLEAGTSCGTGDAAARRAAGGHQLPLARRPDRQAVSARARTRLHVPAGVPRLRVWARARAPDPDAEAPPTVRPRGRAQSAGELRSFASGDQELMSTIAQSARPAAPARAREYAAGPSLSVGGSCGSSSSPRCWRVSSP